MMRSSIIFKISDINLFKTQLTFFVSSEHNFCLLDSNESLYSNNELIAGIGSIDELMNSSDSFNSLAQFHKTTKDWLFGFFSYDLKNEIENLQSNHFDGIGFPTIHFFQPRYVFVLNNHTITILFLSAFDSAQTVTELFDRINSFEAPPISSVRLKNIKERTSKSKYIDNVSKILGNIHKGDIYEMNYCIEFFSDHAEIDPAQVFLKLNNVTKSPFSTFMRSGDKYLICSSPERFLRKENDKIISQPIKGTIRRGETPREDDDLMQKLKNSDKEKSENVMIVDLVRNDLSRTCTNVQVSELFGVYTFNKWHHMISTITGKKQGSFPFTDVIKNTFPMGSMTGAPKIRAMQLIEQYEDAKRGLYSGAVGYITPDEDFDFNVVIRSICYNASKNYLSFQVGGAITSNSIPEKEYEECLLKAKAIFETLA